MQVSVVVRTKDEAHRLRLTLASLSRQVVPAEVIVVDDGSSDHTAAVIAEASRGMPLRVVTHATVRGRHAASNAGARIATGDLLLFLDGDTLAGPEFVARHAEVHTQGGGLVGRGERFHFRNTRFLLDPETATPRLGQEARLARMPPQERARLRIARDDVMGDFAALARRAEAGIYPGSGPRLLQDIEMDALRRHPECTMLWAAACGSNLSVRREAFFRAGGFDEAIDNNDHRELALRLCQQGARMTLAEGAYDYHMTHRTGWRDPLLDTGWERVFFAAHPVLAVKLLSVFWASLAGDPAIPQEARIMSLPELEIAARGDNGIDYDAVRRMIGTLPELGPTRVRELGVT